MTEARPTAISFDDLRRAPGDIERILAGVQAEPHSSSSGPVLCLQSRTVRTASAFAAAGMLRTDVCSLPRGHRGEHRA